jgi:hypothetical protein
MFAFAFPPGGTTPLECGCFPALQFDVPSRLLIFNLSASVTPVAGIDTAVRPMRDAVPFERVNFVVLLTAGLMRPEAHPVVLPSGIAFASTFVILLVDVPIILIFPALEGGFA